MKRFFGATTVMGILVFVLTVSCQQEAGEGEAGLTEETSVAADEEAGPALSSSERLAWSGTDEGVDTGVFEITAPVWRVRWRAAETSSGVGVFFVHVYTEDGEWRTTVADILGRSGEGAKEVEGGGRYYLSINGAQMEWEVEVEEVASPST